MLVSMPITIGSETLTTLLREACAIPENTQVDMEAEFAPDDDEFSAVGPLAEVRLTVKVDMKTANKIAARLKKLGIA